MRYKGTLNGPHSDPPPAPRSLLAHTCSSPPTCALKSPSQRSRDSGTTWGKGWKCEQHVEAGRTW